VKAKNEHAAASLLSVWVVFRKRKRKPASEPEQLVDGYGQQPTATSKRPLTGPIYIVVEWRKPALGSRTVYSLTDEPLRLRLP